MAILTNETVQIIRGLKADIAQRTGSNGEFNWATDSKELYIHDGKTRGGHLIGKASGTAGVVGGAGIAVSTSDGISTVSIKRDPSSVLYATTDGAGVRLGNSGGLQVTAQNALDLHLAEGGGLVVDSNGLKVDSSMLTSVFRYAGQVNSVDDLPDDASIGDVYDVKDSGVNYVWTGSSWDNLGGILSVDPSPTQGSTNPVASGGVYDAIQAAKLSGDGKTVTVASNTITAKDIAIGGDESDLASSRGFFYDTYVPWWGGSTTATYAVTDFNEFIVPGVYHVRWVEVEPHESSDGTIYPVTENNPNAGNGIAHVCDGILVVQNISSCAGVSSFPRYLHHLFVLGVDYTDLQPRLFTRTQSVGTGESWLPWRETIISSSLGDGISINSGKISVPEYEGATADTAATSGLVPPAAAGEQNKVLRGDGEWGDYLPLSGGNMTGKITSTANPALEQTDSTVSIGDTSRSSMVNKMLAVSLDKDDKRGGGVGLTYFADGSRRLHFVMRNRADTDWLFLGLVEQADGFPLGTSPTPKADSNANTIATTEWVRDRIAEIDIPSEVALSDSVTSDSSTTAASSKAVKTAYDKAVSAATSASTAQSTANSAKTAATNAQNTANSANTKATNAQNTANSALSAAQAAQNTANSAGAKAECVAWSEGVREGLNGQNLPNYGTWRVFDGGTSINLRGRTLAGGTQVAGGSKNYGIAVRIA